MARGSGTPEEEAIPAAELWQGPLAWAGLPPKPVWTTVRGLPENTVFVRAELVYTISQEIGPGMTRQTQHEGPGLMRLEKGRLVELHTAAFDGGCWSFVFKRAGRKLRWELCAGDGFPAREPVAAEEVARLGIEYLVVQSVASFAGTGKYLSVRLRDDFTVEDFGKAVDEDPDD